MLIQKFISSLILTTLLTISCQSQTQTVIEPGLNGQPLLDYITANYKTQHTLGYDRARDTLYSVIDLLPGNQLRCVYSGFTIALDLALDPSTDAYNKHINCEHSWPQSMGAANEPQRSDMHHLFPTKDNVNSSRGNDPFAEIPDANTDVWYRLTESRSSIPTNYIDEYSEKENDSPQCFEPREDHKGNVARAMFYFYAIYQSVANEDFWNLQKATLLAWHYLDPVDLTEYNRTWKIAGYQDNKPNPFVLDSTLARRSWFSGSGTIAQSDFPNRFYLAEAFPNPFNSSMTIQYQLPEFCRVSIHIFNLSGQSVQTLINKFQPAGFFEIQWDASSQSSGVYFYQISTGEFRDIKKCVLLK